MPKETTGILGNLLLIGMMGGLVVFIILGVARPYPVTAAAGPLKLRACLYDNPPKISSDGNQGAAGFWPDIINAIAADEGWQIEWVPGTWSQCIAMLEKGEIDLLPDTGYTPERARKFAFNQETVLISWSRLYASKRSHIASLLDLDGKTIAALGGSFNLNGPEGIRDLTARFDLNTTFVEMDSYEAVFQALEKGEVDAGVTNKDFGNLHEANYGVERTAIIFQPARLLFALPKDAELTPGLIEAIDRQLKSMKEDQASIYYRSLESYIGGEVAEKTTEVVPGWAIKTLLAATLLGVFFLVISLVTRQQVRKRTRQLRKSEEKLRGIVQSMDDLVFVLDRDTCFVSYFAPERELLLSPQDFLGKKISEVMPPEVVREFYAALPEVEQGSSIELEYALALSDGIHWFAANLSPIYENEKYAGLVAVARDITQQKASAVALQESEEKFRTLTEHSPVGMFLINSKGNPTYLNQKCAELVGLPADEALNLDWVKAIHPEDRQRVLSAWLEAVKQGAEFHQEFRWLHADGEIVWTSGDVIPVRRSGGEVIVFIGTLVDITARVLAQAELQRNIQQLETVNAISAALSSSLALEEVLELILTQIKKIIPYDSATIFLIEDNELKIASAQGFPYDLVGRTFQNEDPLFMAIAKTREPIALDDAQQDARFHAWGMTTNTRGWMGVPLIAHDAVIGYMTLDSKQTGVYTAAQVAIVRPYAAQAAQAIENALLYQRVIQDANEMEKRVRARTQELQEFVNLTAGREVRMSDLKKAIRALREQLLEAGMQPVASAELSTGALRSPGLRRDEMED